MITLMEFKFLSEYIIDNQKEKIEFKVKGYKKEEDGIIVYYFKNDNSYKFIINGDNLVVNVNDSIYEFNLNKKTEALIRSDNYSYKVSVTTDKLLIEDKKIEINYILDFNTFIGSYKIILELL